MRNDSELIVLAERRVYHLGMTPEDLAPNVILCGDPGRADLVAGYFDSGDGPRRGQNREFAFRTGRYKGLPVTVLGTGIGPDNTEIVLVETYALRAFDLASRERRVAESGLKLIRVGTCGTPQADLSPGTLAVTACAVGLENTGLFYEVPAAGLSRRAQRIEAEARRIIEEAIPPGRRFKGRLWPYVAEPAPEVVRALGDRAQGDWDMGITVTAPGFYGPQGREIEGLGLTVPKIQEHLAGLEVDGLRVVNFEMETSLLLHLARLTGGRAGSICAIIANRATGEFLADYEPAVSRAALTALEALAALSA
ncbi:MAG: nucleoside phosphorylase [Thermodesulfobacteriota bacterium]